MTNNFDEFKALSKDQWEALVIAELKGESPELLTKLNEVEEVSFSALWHEDQKSKETSDPGYAPFTRGGDRSNLEAPNDWKIGAPFLVENLKETNKLILEALMNGVDSIYLIAKDEEKINFTDLLENVSMEYIETNFQCKTEEQTKDFLEHLENNEGFVVNQVYQQYIAENQKENVSKPFCVSGYLVQQTGANCIQEIAVMLSEGHELIVKQINAGLSIDQAVSNIHFLTGIGSGYFFEIAKLRAFRTLWCAIVSAYQPDLESSKEANITSKTGFTHVTINDPYTNLLRQTTQIMSAGISGANGILAMPYNWFQKNAELSETRRQAVNISLILKEESYFNRVMDPGAGSYFLDELTTILSDKAWLLFQELDSLGGIENQDAIHSIQTKISKTVTIRKSKIEKNEHKLIGKNIFLNPEKVNAQWDPMPNGWNGIPRLVLEN
jgi:methylmalonyl-CoA mutase